MMPEQYVQEKAAASDNSHLASIPNVQTQAAMHDADAWVVEMRANQSQSAPSNECQFSDLLFIEI